MKLPFLSKKEEKEPDQYDIMAIVSIVMETAGKLVFAKDKPAALNKIVSDFITPERLQAWKVALHGLITQYERENNCRLHISIMQAEQQSDIVLIHREASASDGLELKEKVYYLSQLSHEQIMYFLTLILPKDGRTADTTNGQ